MLFNIILEKEAIENIKEAITAWFWAENQKAVALKAVRISGHSAVSGIEMVMIAPSLLLAAFIVPFRFLSVIILDI